jgi:hypothetical protein
MGMNTTTTPTKAHVFHTALITSEQKFSPLYYVAFCSIDTTHLLRPVCLIYMAGLPPGTLYLRKPIVTKYVPNLNDTSLGHVAATS